MFLSLERWQTCFAISCVESPGLFPQTEEALEENKHLLQMSLLSSRNNWLTTLGKSCP